MNMEPMLRRLIGEPVDIDVQYGDDLGKVRIDPSQLEQVVMNLVINARDAMPDGGNVVVRTTKESIAAEKHGNGDIPPGTYCRLAVSDTGAGMDTATRHRIFEPFFTTKEKHRGTGLGLSTVLGILQMSDGHILVDSEPGAGTSMSVLLPQVEADTQSTGTEDSDDPRGGSETILVVEDDAQIRRLVTAGLGRLGYTVLEAATGARALGICADASVAVDLVVTDVIMPGLNGRQVAEAIRKARPATRIIFASGYADDILTRDGDSIADYPLIDKPFDVQTLAKLIRKTLDSEVTSSDSTFPGSGQVAM